MSDATANVRIVVATDNGDDAQQVVRQLKAVFGDVRASIVAGDARAAAVDVESLRPQVLVLAFDTLDEAAAAVAAVEGDYERHSRAARDIAAAYFDSRVVLSRLVDDAFAKTSPELMEVGA